MQMTLKNEYFTSFFLERKKIAYMSFIILAIDGLFYFISLLADCLFIGLSRNIVL